MINICMKFHENSTLLSYVATCYGSGLFANVEFICKDGVRVYSHMFYLSMVSEYLGEILDHQKNDDAVIVMLPDFDGGTVQELMRFIYEGRVDLDLSSDDSKQFFSLADMLCVSTGEGLMKDPHPETRLGVISRTKPIMKFAGSKPKLEIIPLTFQKTKDVTSPKEIDPTSIDFAMEKEELQSLPSFESQERTNPTEDNDDLMEHFPHEESIESLHKSLKTKNSDDLYEDEVNDKQLSFERLTFWLSKDQKLKCQRCEKLFLGPSRLKQHSKVCDKDVLNENEANDKQLSSKRLTFWLSKDQKLKCQRCEKLFLGPSRLKQHSKVCDKDFNCEKCGKVFKRMTYKTTLSFIQSTSQHKRICKGKYNQPENCEFCGKFFGKQFHHLMRHVKGCGSKRDCFVCGKRFLSTWHLKKHTCRRTRKNPENILIKEG